MINHPFVGTIGNLRFQNTVKRSRDQGAVLVGHIHPVTMRSQATWAGPPTCSKHHGEWYGIPSGDNRNPIDWQHSENPEAVLENAMFGS